MEQPKIVVEYTHQDFANVMQAVQEKHERFMDNLVKQANASMAAASANAPAAPAESPETPPAAGATGSPVDSQASPAPSATPDASPAPTMPYPVLTDRLEVASPSNVPAAGLTGAIERMSRRIFPH